jgi:Putative zinc-binding metallo-peptidase
MIIIAHLRNRFIQQAYATVFVCSLMSCSILSSAMTPTVSTNPTHSLVTPIAPSSTSTRNSTATLAAKHTAAAELAAAQNANYTASAIARATRLALTATSTPTPTLDYQYLTQSAGLPKIIEGLVIHYQYDRSKFFPAAWLEEPVNCSGTQVNLSQARRIVPLIEDFASAFDSGFLRSNLKDIYLLSELRCFGKSYGGTNSLSALYLRVGTASQGFTDRYLSLSLHHEFSSILMRNYTFPSQEWTLINGPDFAYSQNSVEVLGQTALESPAGELLKAGFLNRYSMTTLENDFNEIASWLFVRREELCQFEVKYEKIARKSKLVIQFYNSIDPTLAWSACT